MKMAKKEAPAPPKAKARAKALKAKKAVLKGVHSHKKKEDPYVTYIPMAQDAASPKTAQISSKERPQEKQVSTAPFPWKDTGYPPFVIWKFTRPTARLVKYLLVPSVRLLIVWRDC